MKLWYKNHAADWNSALPIGNGRLGAMIHGGVFFENIQLNEDSIWYGKPIDRNNPDALQALPEIRNLLYNGKIKEAERLAVFALSGTPESQRPYQPLGNLYIDFNHPGGFSGDTGVHGYKRELDLEKAIVTVSYSIGNIHYSREYFASFSDQVIAVKISANKGQSVTLSLRLKRELFYDESKSISHDTVIMTGNCGQRGVKFCAMAKAVAGGGTVKTCGDTIIIDKAGSAVIYLSAATTFYEKSGYISACKHLLNKASGMGYDALVARHLADYKKYFERVSIRLADENDDKATSLLATDERLERMKHGGEDNGLISLYFQFGRYLLLSCSREGTLPANLQGIWNKDMSPAWGCKFTININTQMNYWPAEPCNLSECHLPLFDHIRRMRKNGRKTARKMYACRGFVAHHNTDIWADTAPQDIWIPATFWPMGAAWLCIHIWEHYLFTLDLNFLKKHYPLMEEAAVFFIDYLVDDGTGRPVTCPSVSPENTYIHENGVRGSLCTGPSMDSQIIHRLMMSCLEAGQVMKKKSKYHKKFRHIVEKLPKPEIGKEGTILEWAKEYEEAEPGHRHISHLFALHPGNMITVNGTPELAIAASKTLEKRLARGSGHTGWSRAWIINLYSRLLNGEKAYENLSELLRTSTLSNLFDNHPPFQIDGNFGGTAGIAEMLVQSHAGEIHLLPALPSEWKNGRVGGLRCRGGVGVNITWKDNGLKKADFTAIKDCEMPLRYGKSLKRIALYKEKKITIDRTFFER